MTRLALLCVVPLLAACDIDSRNPADSDGKVAINADQSGKLSFTVPFASGEVKLPQSMMRGGEVDVDGVKLMPGSKVTGFSVLAGEGKEATVDIAFAAPRPPAEVRSYFAREFARRGAQTTASADGVSATTSDGDWVQVRVGAEGGGSKGVIAIRSKD